MLAAPDGLACARCRRPVRHPTATPSPPHLRGKVLTTIRSWPEGPICSGCYAKACETYGVCDGCGVDRLLPGIGPGGQRWCTDCAGGIGDFTCTRCGQEGWKHYKGVCSRCVLRDRLATALDDGCGRIRPELQPLFDHVVALDLSRGMLRQMPDALASRVHADSSCLPLATASIHVVVLVNMLLFPAEIDRVLASDGILVWVNSLGDRTPIHLPAEDVAAALPGSWNGIASEAGWGTWCLLTRDPP